MSENCIFCKIVAGEIPGDIVYQDEHVLAFRDIRPVAPTHVLVCPKAHVESVQHLEDAGLAAALLLSIPKIAAQEGVAGDGYRLICNAGKHGRQEVPHLHIHLIGGRIMEHPLG